MDARLGCAVVTALAAACTGPGADAIDAEDLDAIWGDLDARPVDAFDDGNPDAALDDGGNPIVDAAVDAPPAGWPMPVPLTELGRGAGSTPCIAFGSGHVGYVWTGSLATGTSELVIDNVTIGPAGGPANCVFSIYPDLATIGTFGGFLYAPGVFTSSWPDCTFAADRGGETVGFCPDHRVHHFVRGGGSQLTHDADFGTGGILNPDPVLAWVMTGTAAEPTVTVVGATAIRRFRATNGTYVTSFGQGGLVPLPAVVDNPVAIVEQPGGGVTVVSGTDDPFTLYLATVTDTGALLSLNAITLDYAWEDLGGDAAGHVLAYLGRASGIDRIVRIDPSTVTLDPTYGSGGRATYPAQGAWRGFGPDGRGYLYATWIGPAPMGGTATYAAIYSAP